MDQPQYLKKIPAIWWCNLLAATALALLTTSIPAAALSEELARKCYDLTFKAYPRPDRDAPYRAVNTNVSRERQQYYDQCLAADGNVERQTLTESSRR